MPPCVNKLYRFFLIPGLSHSDRTGITTNAPCEAPRMGARHVRMKICISLCVLLCDHDENISYEQSVTHLEKYFPGKGEEYEE